MLYTTNSFEYNTESRCTSCNTTEMVQDNRNDTFSPLLDFAIEAMLNGSPCSSAHPSNAINATGHSSSSRTKLVRPPRQSLPQQSIMDSPSETSSIGEDELSYAGLEMLGEEAEL